MFPAGGSPRGGGGRRGTLGYGGSKGALAANTSWWLRISGRFARPRSRSVLGGRGSSSRETRRSVDARRRGPARAVWVGALAS